MSHQFVAHFISSQRPRRGSESLINIKQKEEESIQTYVNRFNATVLEVQNLDQSVVMAALKSGLPKNDLLFFLKKKYPRDFADLLARAEGYVRAEEAFKLKDKEAVKERQAGDSSKPAAEKGPSSTTFSNSPQTQACPNFPRARR